MFVTYQPEGEPAQEWEFRPLKIRSGRMVMIERAYKKVAQGELATTWDAWLTAVQQGSTPARQVLLWHLQLETHPTLRVEDVDFAAGDIKVEYSRAELEAQRDEKLKAVKVTQPAMTQELSDFLDNEIANAREGSEGKALSTTLSIGTGSDSSNSPDSPPTGSET